MEFERKLRIMQGDYDHQETMKEFQEHLPHIDEFVIAFQRKDMSVGYLTTSGRIPTTIGLLQTGVAIAALDLQEISEGEDA